MAATASIQQTRPLSALVFLAVALVPVVVSFLLCVSPLTTHTVAWALAQWMPIDSIRIALQTTAWDHWEARYGHQRFSQEEIPTVNVQTHRENLSAYLEKTYGSDWRRRPLLLQGLWTGEDLQDSSRRLSVKGLLQTKLRIPYFTDARIQGALSPDDSGAVGDIVRNMTTLGAPHKIGTQLLVQTYPDLIREIAPLDIVTELFGDYFLPDNVKGSGPWNLLPALTTVPVFVANHGENVRKEASSDQSTSTKLEKQPFTALHCEPIGNVAVQLSGRKKWTFVRPEFSFRIKPSVSPDGRAFFASWASDYSNVPTYSAITAAGDAVWVPTWTWHRVDYIESSELAIGGSLFHFRALDFFRNNPLFAVLMVPAMMLELIGYNTQ